MTSLYLGIILTFLGGVLAFVKAWKSKKEKNYKKENTIAIVGFILLVFGAASSFYSGKSAISSKILSDSLSVKKEIENKRISDSLIAAQHYIIQLQKDLNDTTREILFNSNTVIKAQQEVNRLHL